MSDKSWLLQEDLREYVLNKMRTEQWLTLHDSRERRESRQLVDDLLFHCCMIPTSRIPEELKRSDWHDCSIDGQPGCVGFTKGKRGTIEYKRFGSFYDYEPLIIERDFGGVKDGYKELNEEFRLYHNLFFDEQKNTFQKVLDNGDLEDVVKMNGDYIGAHLKQVRQFLGIKDMALCLCFTFCRWSYKTLEELGIDEDRIAFEHTNDSARFSFTCMTWRDKFGGDTRASFSRMIGKVILTGLPKEKSGIWPYKQDEEEEREYPKDVIKTDENGDPVSYTCNHHMLGNFFGANPDAPQYLTRVFFKREVLEKYYNDPKYTVHDGHLTCGHMWSMYIDNNLKNYVSAYLGDLGRDLPFEDHAHWLAHNVVPGEAISKTSLKRDFYAQFSEPEKADLLFRHRFSIFRKDWEEKNSWELFGELPKKDAHHLNSLHIPLRNTQAEFDNQILSLAHVLIESINIEELIKHCSRQYINKEKQGSITWLSRFMSEKSCADAELHISFLRDLQKLRSKGAAHKKGKEYDALLKKFGIDKVGYQIGFERILLKAINFIEYLKGCFA